MEKKVNTHTHRAMLEERHRYACKPHCDPKNYHFVEELRTKKSRRKIPMYHNRYRCVACGLIHDVWEGKKHERS